MEVKKAEEKPALTPLRVFRKKDNISVIEGVTMYPGITVVSAHKREKLLANQHFIDQVEAGHVEVFKDIPVTKPEDAQVSVPSLPVTGDMDVDQANAILACPQAEAIRAIKGDSKKKLPGVLNIPVLKKVISKDSRPAVVNAAEQQLAEVSKPDSEKE